MKKRSTSLNKGLAEIYHNFLLNFEKQRQATGHHFVRLFSDFLELTVRAYHPKSILAIQGVCQPDPENEKAYLSIIENGRYNTQTARFFAENLALLNVAVEFV